MKKHTLGWIDGRQSLIRLALGCLVLTSSLLYSPHSFALTLEQAKQQGRVGETLSGYLAPVKKMQKPWRWWSKSILPERRSIRKWRKNHISTENVAKLAGQKLVNRAAEGEYVRGINGQWMKR